jgi:hypothetical protein
MNHATLLRSIPPEIGTSSSFGSSSDDGSGPVGGLIELGCVLYGTTTAGGAGGDGAVFALEEPRK